MLWIAKALAARRAWKGCQPRPLRPLRDVLPALLCAALLHACAAPGPRPPAAAEGPRRNVIVFVADGLRAGSVNPEDAPTFTAVRAHGVFFANSHALFPTFTTANASAIASGHQLGDTGDYANALWPGFPVFSGTRAAAVFGRTPGTITPFLENNQVIADIDEHFASGSYLTEATLLELARRAGYRTAAIGKLGPVALQDPRELRAEQNGFAATRTAIIDDLTGHVDAAGKAQSPPLPADIAQALQDTGLGQVTPERRQPAGSLTRPGTLEANLAQQSYFVDAATRAVLPVFQASGQPFLLVFWSRDPDGSQHNQGDSLNRLDPGINGPTSRAGVANADRALKQLLDYLAAHPQLAANTDVFVTADHGFATISKHEFDAQGGVVRSYATTLRFLGRDQQPEVTPGWLPPGFLAIELAHLLELPLFDPEREARPGFYLPVDPSGSTPGAASRPQAGNAVIGGSGAVAAIAQEAALIVAANGGADLVYLPDGDRSRLARIVAYLLRQDYVGGLFVHSRHGSLPGTLPLSAVGLEGGSPVPAPDLVVAFRRFARDPAQPLQSAVQISDSGLQEGQGQHGGLGRECTFNNMAAIGPDFKSGYVDPAPVGNADIVPTLARLMHLDLPAHGQLTGRVLEEALAGSGAALPSWQSQRESSWDPDSRHATVLEFQTLGAQRYLDQACLIASEGPAPALHCP